MESWKKPLTDKTNGIRLILKRTNNTNLKQRPTSSNLKHMYKNTNLKHMYKNTNLKHMYKNTNITQYISLIQDKKNSKPILHKIWNIKKHTHFSQETKYKHRSTNQIWHRIESTNIHEPINLERDKKQIINLAHYTNLQYTIYTYICVCLCRRWHAFLFFLTLVEIIII